MKPKLRRVVHLSSHSLILFFLALFSSIRPHEQIAEETRRRIFVVAAAAARKSGTLTKL